MNSASANDVFVIVEKAERQTLNLLGIVADQIRSVTNGFEGLAHQAGSVLSLSAEIVGCVEDESITSMLPMVRSLCAATDSFIHDRLTATDGILETAGSEARLLELLSQLTRGQRSVARETQSLSVLTNIEIARLGELGAGFQYLARQLGEFAQSVADSNKELAQHTDERKAAIQETRRMLAAGIPRIRQKFGLLQEDLQHILSDEVRSHSELSMVPARFNVCVEEIAGQVASVVGALQTHDITRQQLEHVQESLRIILTRFSKDEEDTEDSEAGPTITAGLAIQVYQLRSIEMTVGHWVSLIGTCMDAILRISASELANIGPSILEHEQRISAQLARIAQLERECQSDNEEVQQTLSGLTSLMQLVGEYLEQSRAVRDRMQLLTFNSIVEASRLGSKADTILEISQSIKRVSVEWSDLTDRTEKAKAEILGLVDHATGSMNVFSAGGSDRLLAAQESAQNCIEKLRAAVASASEKIADAESATAKLKAMIGSLGTARERLAQSFSTIASVLSETEEAHRRLEQAFPDSCKRCDRREVEDLFTSFYTMEIERDVARAALSGGPVPQHEMGRNDVELF